MLFPAILGLLLYGNLCSALDSDIIVLEKLQDLENRLVEQERINAKQQQVIDQQQLTIQQQQQQLIRQEKKIVKLEAIQETQNAIRCDNCDKGLAPNSTKRQQHIRNVQPSLTVRQQPERVAFSSYADSNLEHLGVDHPIKYNRVLLNQGSAYHPSSGIFTCPLDGTYGFYYSISTYGVHEAVAKLVVDGANQVDAITDSIQPNHNAQGANFAMLSLSQGQQVWVANYNGADQSINNGDIYRFSTFSGFLLY